MSKTQSGMMLKVLCTTGVGATVRYVADINVKVGNYILIVLYFCAEWIVHFISLCSI